MASKKQVKLDAFLEAGWVQIMVKHPVTGKETESLKAIANYPQNQPGVVQFAQDVALGRIGDGHEGKSIEDLARIIFATLIAKRDDGWDFVRAGLGKVDETVKKALAEAALHTWRDKLAGLDVQDHAASLFAEREEAAAILADVEARMAALKAEVATTLGIDKTFDLAWTHDGLYVAPSTPSTGKQVVARDYSADEYTTKRTMHGQKLEVSAVVTSRDDDGQPDGWATKYTVLDGPYAGNVYTGEGDSLNDADQGARVPCMADIFPTAISTNNNAPDWYRVPVV